MSDEHHDNGRTHAFAQAVMRKLRGDDRRGISFASITVAVAALGALGGFGLLAMDAGAQKQRIDTIEKRQVEDRSATGEKLNKLDSKAEQINEKVNLILQEIRDMQGEIRAERRANAGRSAAGRRDRD